MKEDYCRPLHSNLLSNRENAQPAQHMVVLKEQIQCSAICVETVLWESYCRNTIDQMYKHNRPDTRLSLCTKLQGNQQIQHLI